MTRFAGTSGKRSVLAVLPVTISLPDFPHGPLFVREQSGFNFLRAWCFRFPCTSRECDFLPHLLVQKFFGGLRANRIPICADHAELVRLVPKEVHSGRD